MTAPRTPQPLRGYTRGDGLPYTWLCDGCRQKRVSQFRSKRIRGGAQRLCAQCVDEREARSTAGLSTAPSASVDGAAA